MLLLAAVALLAGPLAADWAHAHEDQHGSSSAGHGECEAWTVTSGHATHHDGQFEVSEPARHEHHGLCQGLTSLSAVALVEASAASLPQAPIAGTAAATALRGLLVETPPNRGPPVCV